MEPSTPARQPNVLNPVLYNALLHNFGEVRIVHQGQHAQIRYYPDSRRPGKVQRDVVYVGEQYQIDCPHCGDTRKRCYVGHILGILDPKLGQVNWEAWYCHNEQCQADRANRDKLQWKLQVPPQKPYWNSTAPTSRATSPEYRAPSIPLPDGLIPLSELHASHPALQYLLGRNFDPLELESIWGVSYLPADGTIYGNRLIIPVRRLIDVANQQSTATELAGWQARAIVGGVNNDRKYLFPSGMQKSKLLYGLPQALEQHGPVKVCEGVADVWRAGPGAVALFGHSMSPEQRALLSKRFAGRPIVMLLDRDASLANNGLASALRSERVGQLGDRRVVAGQLPPGRKDPGECTLAEIEQIVAAALDCSLLPR